MARYTLEGNLTACTTGHRALFRALEKGKFFERPVVAWGRPTRTPKPGSDDYEARELAPTALVATHSGQLRRAAGLKGFIAVLDPHENFMGLTGGALTTTRRCFGPLGVFTNDLRLVTKVRVRGEENGQ
jgi:hypothetical protein